ncbi:MAG: hypothetical protein IID51_03445 [Proteobacteria bacterium]|nr:hypothetical protein [Pseudomonadota bacterium]
MATLASRQMAIPIIIIELVGPVGQAVTRADREAFGNADLLASPRF